ncbi:conserved Plasmodium protein, unknown function [Plasmodium malariae]|uniref:Uncharacterized protein n=1 Tax=Plasmodium malariae TaxID=5858 RepID=A0A1C3L2F7_PLAMA|nr:conserved Plasmodium protein, unknown function [Plasmodium malariae]
MIIKTYNFNLISKKYAHKFASPDCPNLMNIKKVIYEKLKPICFHIKQDYTMGHHVHDMHFYGILCSPLFENKSYKEMNSMVEKLMSEINLAGRVKLHCQPPSRFNKMKKHIRWRWNLEK